MAVARVTEITASSSKSIEAAIEEGLKRASKTLRGITGLEVVSVKAKVDQGKVREYRVSLKITFVLEE
jgi:hypothetical protein